MARTPSVFSVDMYTADDAHVVRLRGELDLVDAERAERTLVQVAGSTVIADLEDLTFIDGSGISALLRAKRRIERQGDRLVLRNVGSAVRRAIRAAGLEAALLNRPQT